MQFQRTRATLLALDSFVGGTPLEAELRETWVAFELRMLEVAAAEAKRWDFKKLAALVDPPNPADESNQPAESSTPVLEAAGS